MCPTNFQTTVDIANYIVCMVDKYLLPLLVLIAITAFIYYVFQFISNAGDEKKRATAYSYIIWSLVALALIVSMWAVSRLVTSSFGITAVIPQFPTQ